MDRDNERTQEGLPNKKNFNFITLTLNHVLPAMKVLIREEACHEQQKENASLNLMSGSEVQSSLFVLAKSFILTLFLCSLLIQELCELTVHFGN